MTRAIDRLVAAFDAADLRWERRGDKVRAQCPTHGSAGLALMVTGHHDSVGLHCFGGCDKQNVLADLGLAFRDLFDGDDFASIPFRPFRSAKPPRPAEEPAVLCLSFLVRLGSAYGATTNRLDAWTAQCPMCCAEGRTLVLREEGPGGSVWLRCGNGCSWTSVVERLMHAAVTTDEALRFDVVGGDR